MKQRPFKKLIPSHLFKFPEFYATQGFITVYITAHMQAALWIIFCHVDFFEWEVSRL